MRQERRTLIVFASLLLLAVLAGGALAVASVQRIEPYPHYVFAPSADLAANIEAETGLHGFLRAYVEQPVEGDGLFYLSVTVDPAPAVRTSDAPPLIAEAEEVDWTSYHYGRVVLGLDRACAEPKAACDNAFVRLDLPGHAEVYSGGVDPDDPYRAIDQRIDPESDGTQGPRYRDFFLADLPSETAWIEAAGPEAELEPGQHRVSGFFRYDHVGGNFGSTAGYLAPAEPDPDRARATMRAVRRAAG